jgi:hypothetical protein
MQVDPLTFVLHPSSFHEHLWSKAGDGVGGRSDGSGEPSYLSKRRLTRHWAGPGSEKRINFAASANAEGGSGVVPAWKQRFEKWHHLTNTC